MLKFIMKQTLRVEQSFDFKTSHVKVYPADAEHLRSQFEFQNISC